MRGPYGEDVDRGQPGAPNLGFYAPPLSGEYFPADVRFRGHLSGRAFFRGGGAGGGGLHRRPHVPFDGICHRNGHGSFYLHRPALWGAGHGGGAKERRRLFFVGGTHRGDGGGGQCFGGAPGAASHADAAGNFGRCGDVHQYHRRQRAVSHAFFHAGQSHSRLGRQSDAHLAAGFGADTEHII